MKSAKNIVADIVGIMAMDIAQIVLLIKNEQRGERLVLTMDDLISRQAVIDLLKKSASRDIEEVVVTEKNIKLIMDMPKAFDVEKVVEELEEKRSRFSTQCTDYAVILTSSYKNAIDIVKRGGVE